MVIINDIIKDLKCHLVSRKCLQEAGKSF